MGKRLTIQAGVFVVMVAAVAGMAFPAFATEIDKKSCTFKGKKLYGKIQFVNSFPDIKVQEVTSFPDLNVEKVNSFPDKCGKWQIVTAFPDTKVQIVTSFPDVKIQYVTSFPGLR